MNETTASVWGADAADGATGESYEIRSVADFLKVPQDRRRICLREFHAWLTLAEEIPALVQIVAERMGSDGGPVLAAEMHEFVWHDDGKGTASAIIRPEARP